MKNPEPKDLRRFRIDLAYDGRPYSGWQSQAGGNTVQDVLLECLQGICPAISTVQGSGRTDAGVSAEKQVAHFDVPGEWRMGGLEWLRALNSHLPPSIRVVRSGEIDPAFHARFSAVEKAYRYTLAVGEVLPPLLAGLAWHRRMTGDVEAQAEELSRILAAYTGTHDFRAFSANRNDGFDEERDTVRTIREASVARTGPDLLALTVRGDGFLYKMVRFLVGTAVYGMRERVTLSEIAEFLEGGTREKAPYCAPPDGLSLIDVRYPEEFEIFGAT